jgi:hypothetical protein
MFIEFAALAGLKKSRRSRAEIFINHSRLEEPLADHQLIPRRDGCRLAPDQGLQYGFGFRFETAHPPVIATRARSPYDESEISFRSPRGVELLSDNSSLDRKSRLRRPLSSDPSGEDVLFVRRRIGLATEDTGWSLPHLRRVSSFGAALESPLG